MSYGRPNPLKLDSMTMMVTAWANRFFGRTDVSPDPAEGEAEALQDVAKGKDPELDRTLPWPLLVRGMFKILYKDKLTDTARRAGGRGWNAGSPMPSSIMVTPRDWADAFNFITVSYVKSQIFRRPQIIENRTTATGRHVSLALLVQDPGKGREKMTHYLSSGERRNTIRIMRRMEQHRLNIAEMGPVQKYLQSLQEPQNLN